MSAIKTVASAAAPAAPVAPAPVSYGAWAMTDLSEHFYWSSCDVLNAKGSSGLWNALKPGLRDQETLLLESDADEQLLATVVFNGRVKVHSIQVDAPSDGRAPKKLKLFANQLGLDFDSAEDAQADQTIELTPDMMGKRLELKFVKFQSVDRLTLFVTDNQDGKETSAVSGIKFWGASLQTTNMKAFKRVAGEAGERE